MAMNDSYYARTASFQPLIVSLAVDVLSRNTISSRFAMQIRAAHAALHFARFASYFIGSVPSVASIYFTILRREYVRG